MSVEWGGGGSKSVSLQCSFPGINFQQRPCRASAGTGEPKKIRLRLFRRVAAFQFHSYSLCPFWSRISSIFILQSRELLHDRIHIVVNSLSLNADRSSHCFSHDGQPCEALDSYSRFLNFFDNPGQSLIQSAKYLLSWFRIGRYLQCPPRKEPQDIRFATSPMRPSYSQLRTFRQGRQVPRNPKMVSIELRDQLIKSIISQFEEQCRESLSIDQTILESKQGK